MNNLATANKVQEEEKVEQETFVKESQAAEIVIGDIFADFDDEYGAEEGPVVAKQELDLKEPFNIFGDDEDY